MRTRTSRLIDRGMEATQLHRGLRALKRPQELPWWHLTTGPGLPWHRFVQETRTPSWWVRVFFLSAEVVVCSANTSFAYSQDLH
jgi:hypothetical protein